VTSAWPNVHIGIVLSTAFLQILIYHTLTKIFPQNITYPLCCYKQLSLSLSIVQKASAARSLTLPEFCYRFTTPQLSLVPFIQAVSSVATVRLT